MKPVSRRFALVVAAMATILSAGCTGSVLRSRSQSPERATGNAAESPTKLVGNYTSPFGTNYIRVEGPALVTGLSGTGSDPPPGAQRAALLADMQAHKVINPNKVLASPSNSLVWLTAYVPPGVRKGDPLDVEVRVPGQSETTSIRGGWMMETRLKEMAVLGGQIHDGHVWAVAEGPVLVDPVVHGSTDPVSQLRGVVLGGGVATKPRQIGLLLRDSEKSVFLSKRIGESINRRFHTYAHGMKQGVATPRTDARIDLEIHPRYKYNLARYLRVIRSVPLFETPQEQLVRLELLQRQLLDPVTSAQAALRLEAVGKEGVRVLKKGLESKDAEVRFHAAEALAYLDESCAVETLSEAAKNEPAFRSYALTALSALNDVHAADALRDLFDVPSAETRYGAFRALWAMHGRDPQMIGEHLNQKFWLHEVPSAGAAMVHMTHSYRPEIVLFGEGQKFRVPLTLEAGNSIIVKSQDDGRIRISRFSAGDSDQVRVVENSVAEVIRGIAAVRGDYPDVVQLLQEARSNGALASRFEVDALPERGRAFDRNRRLARAVQEGNKSASKASFDADSSSNKNLASAASDSQPGQLDSGDVLPNLFGDGAPKFSDASEKASDSVSDEPSGDAELAKKPAEQPTKTTARRKGFWVK